MSFDVCFLSVVVVGVLDFVRMTTRWGWTRQLRHRGETRSEVDRTPQMRSPNVVWSDSKLPRRFLGIYILSIGKYRLMCIGNHTYLSYVYTNSLEGRRRSLVIRPIDGSQLQDSTTPSGPRIYHKITRGGGVFSTRGAIASTVEDDRAMQPPSTTTTSSSFFGSEKRVQFLQQHPSDTNTNRQSY